MIKKDTKNELVTKGYFEKTLDETFNRKLKDFEKTFKSSLISDLIKEERSMLHKALLESFENAKVYHQKETDKYIKVLMDEWKDESRVFHDYMKGIKDTQETHEDRISKLELSFR